MGAEMKSAFSWLLRRSHHHHPSHHNVFTLSCLSGTEGSDMEVRSQYIKEYSGVVVNLVWCHHVIIPTPPTPQFTFCSGQSLAAICARTSEVTHPGSVHFGVLDVRGNSSSRERWKK